jgi:hypothetical protein
MHAFLAATDREYDDSVLGSGPGLVADVPLLSPLSPPPRRRHQFLDAATGFLLLLYHAA